jgi:hypothetical protein
MYVILTFFNPFPLDVFFLGQIHVLFWKIENELNSSNQADLFLKQTVF